MRPVPCCVPTNLSTVIGLSVASSVSARRLGRASHRPHSERECLCSTHLASLDSPLPPPAASSRGAARALQTNRLPARLSARSTNPLRTPSTRFSAPRARPPPPFSSQVQLPQVHLGPAEGHLPPRLLCDALQLGRLALAPAARQGEGHVPRGVDEHVLLAPAARADAQRARPSRARPLRSWRRASGRRQRCDTQARA